MGEGGFHNKEKRLYMGPNFKTPKPTSVDSCGVCKPIFNWFNPPTLVEFIQCFIPDLTHLNWFQLISTVFTWFHPHFTKALPFTCIPAAVAAAPDWLAPRLVRRMEVQDLRAVAVDGEDLSSGQLGLGAKPPKGTEAEVPKGVTSYRGMNRTF